MKKIGLFMLSPLTHGGGAEKYFINLANFLAESGNSVEIVTLNNDSYYKFAMLFHCLRLQLKVLFKPINLQGREPEDNVKKSLKKVYWSKISLSKLNSYLKTFDVIYAKNELLDLLVLKFIGYKNLPPLIIGVHTPIYYKITKSFFSKMHNFIYTSVFYRLLLKGAKIIHVSNQDTYKMLKQKINTPISLIYYPFSVSNITSQAESNPSPIKFDKNKVNVIFLGRLSEQKGIKELARLINYLITRKKNLNKITINIFGTGDEASTNIIKQLVKKNDFVHYYGHVNNKFIPSIIKWQNLLISPALWEILPYNILEAQALGVPVVAYDIPGPKDIIIDRITGYLARNENDFLKKTADIIDKKVNFSKIKIVNNIKEKFDPDKINNRLEKMFFSVI